LVAADVDPNQPLDVRFAGGDAPPFAGSIIAPPALTMIEPPCFTGASACPPFDRSRDLAVRWTVADGFVRIDVRKPADTIIAAHCVFDARAGLGVIPRALVPPLGKVSLWVHTYAATTIRGADGSALHLRVDAPSKEWTFVDR